MYKLAMAGLLGLATLISPYAGAQAVAKVPPPNKDCNDPDTPDGSARRCVVKVHAIVASVTPPTVPPSETCSINAPNYVLLPNSKKKVVIVWDLDPGFVFCPALGDGVFLVDPKHVDDDEFDDFGVSDDGVGRSTFKRCRNKFRVLAENRAHPGKDYSYRLQFRRDDPTKPQLVCTVDPWIKNG